MSDFCKKRVIPTLIILVVTIITISIPPNGWPFRVLFVAWCFLAGTELDYLMRFAQGPYINSLVKYETVCIVICMFYVIVADRTSLILLVFCAWASDGAALVVGKVIGGRLIPFRPFPKISPKKTWEGCVAQIIASIIIVFVLIEAGLVSSGAWLFAAVGLLSLFGDLLGSAIKRKAGAKDSCDFAKREKRLIAAISRVLKDHGGCLDRIDSIVFSGAILGIIQFLVL